ncbi:putative ribonuclease H protein [Cardamine amara subsp. amara]|uniref:Ribonuclease H protein n=1 Tax=Cardamine amara subsp. amara TaxID=228776 RepID=A0ABD1BHS6_CARAN
MNTALLAKVGWRIIHDNVSLWARVLRKKYKVADVHDMAWTIAKSNWSSTWRSVGMGLREVVLQGLSWVIGDGRNIKFWTDKWLNNRVLVESAVVEIPERYMELCARDLWINGTGWDLTRILPFVAENLHLELAIVVLDTVTGAKTELLMGIRG